LERAVPAIEDGFKPVQRRIMHSLKELMMVVTGEGGETGHTMQYHPHGDQSIGDAMVHWSERIIDRLPRKLGNILTGDGAAASRYIEAFVQVCF
jgi:topoisomerase-4 subunit A